MVEGGGGEGEGGAGQTLQIEPLENVYFERKESSCREINMVVDIDEIVTELKTENVVLLRSRKSREENDLLSR